MVTLSRDDERRPPHALDGELGPLLRWELQRSTNLDETSLSARRRCGRRDAAASMLGLVDHRRPLLGQAAAEPPRAPPAPEQAAEGVDVATPHRGVDGVDRSGVRLTTVR